MRVLFALFVLVPFAALANGLDDFLAFNAATKSATATFEQQAYDRSGKVVDRSSGRFAFARPGKFRWAYEKPHRQLLVADGTKLWIYDPDLQQVTVKRIDQAISSTPAALLAGKDDITRLFTLRDAGTKDGLAWVEALPKAKDTGFDRVRYTGKPVYSVRGLRVVKDGVELTFTQPLDKEAAADLQNFSGKRWNYERAEHYGSFEFSVAEPKKHGRDPISITSSKLSNDGKTLQLAIADFKPVMQEAIKFKLKARDGTPIAQEIQHTVHALP